MPIFGKKKEKLGFKPKCRTKEELNQDYNIHAVHAGHKLKQVAQLEKEIARLKINIDGLEEEIGGHVDKMLEANADLARLPNPVIEEHPTEEAKGNA